ncbi:MAG TPA: DUF6496 domain-containing protein [Flavitalea sp.]|nr:DUF6496 domain-containing protein [Flavitalea sp.]
MAKYSKGAKKGVEEAMHEFKKGKLKSGRGGKGGRVKSRQQAIAIGLSEAREKGAKVPKKKSTKKSAARSKAGRPKKAATKKSGSKTARKKGARKKSSSKRGR